MQSWPSALIADKRYPERIGVTHPLTITRSKCECATMMTPLSKEIGMNYVDNNNHDMHYGARTDQGVIGDRQY